MKDIRNLSKEEQIKIIREKGKTQVFDLRKADLRGTDLSLADLRGADLCGADLSWANLRGTDLSLADLCGADLSGADLSGANLRWAKITSSQKELIISSLCLEIVDEKQLGVSEEK
jgi:uncharacterized protein YjbI with pentapeptide repeats